MELDLNRILHYDLLSGKEQFKNTFCNDYNTSPSIYGTVVCEYILIIGSQ